ncbi:MAG TPA: hypothetical protein VFM59_01740, partial [Salinimicrobium sp.]|nr:hypothetical protein [Salinimicrobium sp.]
MPDQKYKKFNPHPLSETGNTSGIEISREKDFDEITGLAAQFCDVPIAVINFVENDSCWPKSAYGISEEDIPIEECFWKPVL